MVVESENLDNVNRKYTPHFNNISLKIHLNTQPKHLTNNMATRTKQSDFKQVSNSCQTDFNETCLKHVPETCLKPVIGFQTGFNETCLKYFLLKPV